MQGTRVSRRSLVGLIGAFATGAAVIACGGGDKKETPSGAATTGASPATGGQANVGTAAPGEKLASQQVFRTYFEDDPPQLDYNKDLYGGGPQASMAGLLQMDENYNVLPDIAESFTTNADGSVYTFKIRKGSTWSNGDPVTAKDFEWSWKRNLNPATAATYAGFLFDIKGAEAYNNKKAAESDLGLKAIDDNTLEVTLEGPRGYFPILVAYAAALPANRKGVEQNGDKYGTEADKFISNGAFKITKWEHNKSMELVKHDGYWNKGKVTLTNVNYKIIPATGLLAAYENNELDWNNRGAFGDLKRLSADAKLSKEIYKFSVVGMWYLMPNPNFPPFDNKNVRLALAHAIDRDAIAKGVFQGLSQAAYTVNPPGTPGYNPNKYEEFTKFDPKVAMDMLKGTPYEGGKNWPKMDIVQRTEGDVDAEAAQAIIQMIKKNLNWELGHEVGERKAVYDRMYQGKIPLMWVRWYMDYPDQNNNNWQLFYSKQPESARRSHWVNEEYDKIVNDAKGEKDQEKRKQAYYKSDEVLAKDAGAIFVHYPYRFGLMKPRVKGMPVNKQGDPVPDFNIFVRMIERLRIVEG